MVKDKGKSTACEEEVVFMEGVNVRVSNQSLIGVNEIQVGSGVVSGGKKMKECVLKDVTNVLEARPINLKLAWTGSSWATVQL